MVFEFVRTTAFLTFGTMSFARECSMSPLLAVATLGNARVHGCASNCSDVLAKIERTVDECFGF